MHVTSAHDKSLGQIALFVVFLHAILILWVIFVPFSSQPKTRQQTERLVVKTVQLNPQIEKPPVKPQVMETPKAPAPVLHEPEIAPLPEPVAALEPEIIPQVIEKAPEPEKPGIKPEKAVEAPKPEPVKKAEAKKPQVVKKATTQKKTAPVEKKQVKKPEPVKKTTTAKKTAAVKKPETAKTDPKIDAAKAKAQQQAQEKQQKLLAAAQESIAKIEQGRAKMNASKSSLNSVAAPLAITGLQIDALPTNNAPPLTPGEASYRDELASRLKLMLKLPEHGDVQLKLTLDRSGKVMKVVIVKAASSANKSYVEKILRGLKFPSFGNQFENMSEYTFFIHLSNEL